MYISVRITPACAGRTIMNICPFNSSKDHPRVCGKNAWIRAESVRVGGSPPRVREERRQSLKKASGVRITPACAGRTHLPIQRYSKQRDHPRVCGKNNISDYLARFLPGSPPRVREELKKIWYECADDRITPACAGRTTIGVTDRCFF